MSNFDHYFRNAANRKIEILNDAILISIRIGYPSGAYVYARMAARFAYDVHTHALPLI